MVTLDFARASSRSVISTIFSLNKNHKTIESIKKGNNCCALRLSWGGKNEKRGLDRTETLKDGEGGPDGKTSSMEQAVKIRRKRMNIYNT